MKQPVYEVHLLHVDMTPVESGDLINTTSCLTFSGTRIVYRCSISIHVLGDRSKTKTMFLGQVETNRDVVIQGVRRHQQCIMASHVSHIISLMCHIADRYFFISLPA